MSNCSQLLHFSSVQMYNHSYHIFAFSCISHFQFSIIRYDIKRYEVGICFQCWLLLAKSSPPGQSDDNCALAVANSSGHATTRVLGRKNRFVFLVVIFSITEHFKLVNLHQNSTNVGANDVRFCFLSSSCESAAEWGRRPLLPSVLLGMQLMISR